MLTPGVTEDDLVNAHLSSWKSAAWALGAIVFTLATLCGLEGCGD